MKISELIYELQATLDINGDGEVELHSPMGQVLADAERIEIDRYGNVTICGEG